MFGWIMGFAALIVVLGVTSLTEATLGVGGIAIGCYLAICARLVQSRQQHAQLLRALGVPFETETEGKTLGGEIQTEVQTYASR